MTIYQTKPTIVVSINNEVFKLFSNLENCEEEFNRLGIVTLPLVEKCAINEYEMSVVKTRGILKNILIMERADGICLSSNSFISKRYVYLIGKYLAKFHLKNFKLEGIPGKRQIGDFVIDHIYINKKTEVITLIDPGKSFMMCGNQLEDVVRFMYSVMERYRYRPFIACSILKSFINGYKTQKSINANDLKNTVDFREKRSLEKYYRQKTLLRARLGHFIMKYNRAFLLLVLKYKLNE